MAHPQRPRETLSAAESLHSHRVAPTARQPAIPGPRVYVIPLSSVSLRPASFKARPIAIGCKARDRTTDNH
ncbi:hypothetical protein PGTUg99_003691 [Puccinia graminis f. sp. tritici]|uniref:Uncharacterized protein n=1 Tax=Puccinia graminis f. sp. tritici TaxID=56615 RepID=A0A5B0RW03_PUCGR|nr:hypothetical protein PGTUg99_003691 [Puccinia graminis f. sp. tritici]